MARTILGFLVLLAVSATAQTPSPDAMAISLHTMAKALAGCKTAYTRVLPGHKDAMFQEVLGKENYDKDVASLGHAERFTVFLISHPDQISGKLLVSILSTSDDFALGLQSTQTEILRHLVLGDKLPGNSSVQLLAIDSLADCQHRLFDAGDDYVGLVIDYVGSEDEALGKGKLFVPKLGKQRR